MLIVCNWGLVLIRKKLGALSTGAEQAEVYDL